jgi:hypothetical protein
MTFFLVIIFLTVAPLILRILEIPKILKCKAVTLTGRGANVARVG